ncbi:glycosyltransferase family 4 protein [Pararhizobium haloflavum]|uniref:glycosyltransferase family 4 protein n=1 Tax=Pararhizobium haloflavum TaxID=2037914 RepID=UPI000C17F357|nr:glycosyltransferase family 4 protein [Pararhizobium haloflavum]
MRVGVATVFTPDVAGGAELHADGLVDALKRAGHQVHRITGPFHFSPVEATRYAMDAWASQDHTRYGGGQIDRMICLKFPTYLMSHPDKVVWLLHQHRPAYELFGTEYGFPAGDAQAEALRTAIIADDTRALGSAQAVFANAGRVAERLMANNGVASTPLYHPPADAEAFHVSDAEPYIFVPSRIEALKRQDLLIRALAETKSPAVALISGNGGRRETCEALAHELGIAERVRFLGNVTRQELITLYAKSLGVFFGPLDEDYGYVTLEAMLSSKPVITCRDSGGPLEFVIDGQTGFVTDPQPAAVAAAIDRLYADRRRAAQLGRNGRDRYASMGISWDNVVEKLLAAGRIPEGMGD